MENKISIRKATIRDANTFANILNQSWKDTYNEYISIEHIDDEFNIERMIAEFDNTLKNGKEHYIIFLHDEPVGILELGATDAEFGLDKLGYGEICSFHIKKEHTHKGIGTYALDFALKRLTQLKFKHICVWVKKQNHNAIMFYKKHDFKETRFTCENPLDGAPSFILIKE